ncbi:unnamed protein product [Prunus armeniaca]
MATKNKETVGLFRARSNGVTAWGGGVLDPDMVSSRCWSFSDRSSHRRWPDNDIVSSGSRKVVVRHPLNERERVTRIP